MTFVSVLRLIALIALGFASDLAFGATTNLVQIGDFFFSPKLLTITNGDTVQWRNTATLNSHDTTSSNAPPVWASTTLGNNQTFSFKFTAAGSYPYHCQFHQSTHPEQNGTVTVIAGPNVLPSVSITNPLNNATFTAPATFSIQASASDSDGSIAQVEFFRGTTSLGIDASNPYSATANSLAAGTYTISAVATDNSGGKATNSITVVVKNPPQAVTISNPLANGATFTFSFLTETGRTYTVQFEPQLDPQLWQTLTNFVANGTNAVITDSNPADQRFYRVGAQ